MSVAAGAVNLALGTVFVTFAVLLAVELRRNLPTLGWTHLGVALLAMAVTCGPHHLFHGLHLVEGYGAGAGIDVVTALPALPFGAVWVALRIEAFRGGRGDRFLPGSPFWVLALPTVGAVGATIVVAGAIERGPLDPGRLPEVLPNVVLTAIYALIASYLIRTQLANRRPLGGWSLSGVCLSAVFVACTAMHAVYVVLVLDGSYPVDAHVGAIDVLSVPAAAYFLWTVGALHRGRLPDWNRARPTARRCRELEPRPPAIAAARD